MTDPPRMSLFAQRKKQTREETKQIEIGKQNITEKNEFGEKSYVATGSDAEHIHQENVQKLSIMSHEDIIKEQKKLLSELDPGLVEFLKTRRQEAQKAPKAEEVRREESIGIKIESKETEEDVKQLFNKYPHMDVVENEKLQWIGELPKNRVPPTDPYPARFNFEGELLPFMDKGEGVLQGLHNHGEEQERPGYTLQELIQLSRSSVLQQRVIALNSLAKIMANAFRYNDCFSEPLLPALLEADMYLLLRFSLDDTAQPVVMASATAICNLIVNHTDELCLDVLMGSPLGIQQPSLGVVIEMKPDDIAELKDPELLKLDIVKGTFRTNLIERILYIIKHLPCEPVEIKNMLKTITRISRHSYETAQSVFSFPGLLSTVMELVNRAEKGSFYPEALKLFRILSARSYTLATKIIENYPVTEKICHFIAGVRAQGHPEEMQLALESFYTWQTLLKYNLATSLISDLFPVIMKMLEAHLGLTNITSTKSDLEHGAALISTLVVALKSNSDLVLQALPMICQASSKWISQLIYTDRPSFSSSKLVGVTLQFLTAVLPKFDSSKTLITLLFQLFKKNTFNKSISQVRKYSWLLSGHIIPCPENLPCLGSLPPIVHKESVLPFVIYLGAYLLAIKSAELIEYFLHDTQLLRYISEVLESDNLKTQAGHWYARQEIYFLVLIVHLYTATEVNTNQSLFHQLAFTLLTTVQSGDKYLLPEIISKTIFNSKFFRLDVKSISDKLEALKIDDSESKFNSVKHEILKKAIENLPKIEICYVKELGLENISVPSTPPTLTGVLNATQFSLPSDWIFLPILRIYERQGNDPNAVEIVTRCLEWLIVTEEFIPEIISETSLAAKYCRLCCVYLSGNDLFREVTPHLEIALSYITKRYKYLDFETAIPGLVSFYDFYRQVLDQFAGVSYCDEVFGQYVLVPLAQKHSSRYKKLIWSELAAVLRILRTPTAQVNMIHYYQPLESDFNILMTYLHALAMGRLMEAWCPVLYNVTVHHVSHYVASHTDKTAKLLLSRIEKLGNKGLKELLLRECQLKMD